jgi:hypothetical protein
MEWGKMNAADLETRVPSRIFERGVDLYEQGNVVETCRAGLVWAGRVAGNGGVYKARLWSGVSGMEGECNCAYPGFCKHLVALTLEMLNHPERFADVGAKAMSIISGAGGAADLLDRLIEKDPFNFLEVIAAADRRQPDFRTHRSLVNLVRNLFTRPALTKKEAELLWDQLTETLVLLKAEISAGNPGLAETLTTLFNGAIAEYEKYRNEMFMGYLVDLLTLTATVPEFFAPETLRPLLKVLLDAYFNPRVWELSAELRKTVAKFLRRDPECLQEYLTSSLQNSESETIFRLIAGYELLAVLPQELTDIYATQVHGLEEGLIESEEGRLWLIDRWTESHPGKAKKLAREGLSAAAPSQKGVFRDRLIRLYQGQGEYRQAASLSFVQFCETPDFEEYLRLKDLLAGRRPGDWAGYLHRMRSLAETQGMTELLLRMAFDIFDTEPLMGVAERIGTEDPHLTLFARNLADRWFPAMGSCYSLIVENLLMRGDSGDLDLAIRVAMTLQTGSRKEKRPELWEEFRKRLWERLPELPGRMRRFGKVLDGEKSLTRPLPAEADRRRVFDGER